MGWSIGFDTRWDRDIGYGVPAYCDRPDCNAEIDRGLGHVCGNGEPRGGGKGCGLYFCDAHGGSRLCARCSRRQKSFEPKPDHPRWIQHKMTDPSWEEWRNEQAVKV